MPTPVLTAPHPPPPPPLEQLKPLPPPPRSLLVTSTFIKQYRDNINTYCHAPTTPPLPPPSASLTARTSYLPPLPHSCEVAEPALSAIGGSGETQGGGGGGGERSIQAWGSMAQRGTKYSPCGGIQYRGSTNLCVFLGGGGGGGLMVQFGGGGVNTRLGIHSAGWGIDHNALTSIVSLNLPCFPTTRTLYLSIP